MLSAANRETEMREFLEEMALYVTGTVLAMLMTTLVVLPNFGW